MVCATSAPLAPHAARPLDRASLVSSSVVRLLIS